MQITDLHVITVPNQRHWKIMTNSLDTRTTEPNRSTHKNTLYQDINALYYNEHKRIHTRIAWGY